MKSSNLKQDYFKISHILLMNFKKFRVNSVSPGPIWTPFIPAVEPGATKESFGEGSPLERPGEAYELAPAYVYLASEDSSYVTGQVIHVNGGGVVST